jgi:hypothetical protein
MLRLLLQIAVGLFLLWVILNLIGAVFGGLIHLLWIVIVVALVIWAWQYATGRRGRSRML